MQFSTVLDCILHKLALFPAVLDCSLPKMALFLVVLDCNFPKSAQIPAVLGCILHKLALFPSVLDCSLPKMALLPDIIEMAVLVGNQYGQHITHAGGTCWTGKKGPSPKWKPLQAKPQGGAEQACWQHQRKPHNGN